MGIAQKETFEYKKNKAVKEVSDKVKKNLSKDEQIEYKNHLKKLSEKQEELLKSYDDRGIDRNNSMGWIIKTIENECSKSIERIAELQKKIDEK